MTLPPLDPDVSTSGISVDPRTLERVVASTRRPDGSVRKELRIRPGFTPQEDVGLFRTSRQKATEARSSGGQRTVPGWVPPEQPKKKAGKAGQPAGSSSAKKTAQPQAAKKETPKEKKAGKKVEKVKDSWEDEDDQPPQAKDPTSTTDDKPSEVKTEDSTDISELSKKVEGVKLG